MKPRISILALTCLLGAFTACREKPKEEQPVVLPAPVESPAENFLAPVDGLLRPGQAQRFLLAHRALVKINGIFLDSLSTGHATPDQKRALLQAMEIAREKVARKYGLAGYAEYRWILEEAPKLPENAELLRQGQASVAP